jgi:FtsP/CotA-like multicopper oxidase with cupredoxin domain
MKRTTANTTVWALLLVAMLASGGAVADVTEATPESVAGVNPQCPGDTDGDAVPEPGAPGYDPNVDCMHLTAGDGFTMMADGRMQYIFGFNDVTGTPRDQVIQAGTLRQQWPAPIIIGDEGRELYLSLTNVGMQIRPDLFDPHTVHFHGYPQAASVLDGLPESSISINMGSTITYYYMLDDPGTYMYHCHVEATEHMQMGMLGNLYVRPEQNHAPAQTFPNGWNHAPGMTYAYNDFDGSTYYDAEYAIQLASFDSDFHDASESVAPLPFAEMRPKYAMINGRGYPDTVYDAPIANAYNGNEGQILASKIVAVQGQRTLLRISSLDVHREFTLQTDGFPLRVVGKDARLLRARLPGTGNNVFIDTSSVTLGGGSTVDVLIDLDTYDVPVGVYPLYTTNLNYLSNEHQDFGGMMTEIHVVAAP